MNEAGFFILIWFLVSLLPGIIASMRGHDYSAVIWVISVISLPLSRATAGLAAFLWIAVLVWAVWPSKTDRVIKGVSEPYKSTQRVEQLPRFDPNDSDSLEFYKQKLLQEAEQKLAEATLEANSDEIIGTLENGSDQEQFNALVNLLGLFRTAYPDTFPQPNFGDAIAICKTIDDPEQWDLMFNYLIDEESVCSSFCDEHDVVLSDVDEKMLITMMRQELKDGLQGYVTGDFEVRLAKFANMIRKHPLEAIEKKNHSAQDIKEREQKAQEKKAQERKERYEQIEQLTAEMEERKEQQRIEREHRRW